MRARTWIVTASAGLVLADASIVTLALPELLKALDTSIEGVAAVIAVYTGVLALSLLPAETVRRQWGTARTGVFGFALFALASAVCAGADTLTVLLSARAIQAFGGALGLVAAFDLIAGGTSVGRRHWLGAAVFASAVGPALGGALTQAFDWRAIFVVQVPVAVAGALAALSGEGRAGLAGGSCRRDRVTGGKRLVTAIPTPPARSASETHTPALVEDTGKGWRGWGRLADAVALALVSAALTAVLFGLVLLLIAGWAIEPLAAAATVTVLPLAAVAGSRVGGRARMRGGAGSLLVGGGVLALAWLPSASVAWTFAPQLLAGVGMGMALPAFAGELLPERTTLDAARLLTVRHAGIALVLIALAPLIAHRLEIVTERAQQQGIALVLDARLPPQDKLSLAPELLAGVEAERPRTGLEQALARHRGDYDGAERATFNTLATRADDTIVSAVGDAFRATFLIAGALALLAAALVAAGAANAGRARTSERSEAADADRAGGVGIAVTRRLPPVTRSRRQDPPAAALRTPLVGAMIAAAIATPAAYAVLHKADEPTPVVLRDPCKHRDLPQSGGITGFLQDRALQALDASACRLGSNREELVLALANAEAAKRFKQRYGVDPSSVGGLLKGLISP